MDTKFKLKSKTQPVTVPAIAEATGIEATEADATHIEHDDHEGGFEDGKEGGVSDYSANGRVYFSIGISNDHMYMLDWEQLRRLVHRCGFWYTVQQAQDEDPVHSTASAHALLVCQELQMLYQRVDRHKSKRMRFVTLVADYLMDHIEGPLGLGSTTKDDFEKTVLAVLNGLRVRIKVDDFEFFSRLKALRGAQETWDEEQRQQQQQQQEQQQQVRRRGNRRMTAVLRPSLTSLLGSSSGKDVAEPLTTRVVAKRLSSDVSMSQEEEAVQSREDARAGA